jgi:hypothetical protein
VKFLFILILFTNICFAKDFKYGDIVEIELSSYTKIIYDFHGCQYHRAKVVDIKLQNTIVGFFIK